MCWLSRVDVGSMGGWGRPSASWLPLPAPSRRRVGRALPAAGDGAADRVCVLLLRQPSASLFTETQRPLSPPFCACRTSRTRCGPSWRTRWMPARPRCWPSSSRWSRWVLGTRAAERCRTWTQCRADACAFCRPVPALRLPAAADGGGGAAAGGGRGGAGASAGLARRPEDAGGQRGVRRPPQFCTLPAACEAASTQRLVPPSLLPMPIRLVLLFYSRRAGFSTSQRPVLGVLVSVIGAGRGLITRDRVWCTVGDGGSGAQRLTGGGGRGRQLAGLPVAPACRCGHAVRDANEGAAGRARNYSDATAHIAGSLGRQARGNPNAQGVQRTITALSSSQRAPE